jgi:hypothetical protein
MGKLTDRIYVAEVELDKGKVLRLRFDDAPTPEHLNSITELYNAPLQELIPNCGIYDLYIFKRK